MSLVGKCLVLGAAVVFLPASHLQQSQLPVKPHIEQVDALDLRNVKAEAVSYRGRKAIRITDAATNAGDDVSRIAIVKASSLQDGTIEVSLSGDTLPTAAPTARGFVGIAFRVSGDASHYECFYLRPKNGRAEDQLQRNHSAQYISIPGFDWYTLRQATPGKYESYVDLVPGEWTKVKIKVAGTDAQLFVNDSEQPVLVVHDLKQTPQAGAIALWVGPGTIAHFADLGLQSTP
jgi:hypothetical protein